MTFVHVPFTPTTACEVPGNTRNECISPNSLHQVADNQSEIDDESHSESDIYSFSAAVTLSPSQITRTNTSMEITKGVLLTEGEELQNLSSEKSSSHSSSWSCSSLDAYLDVINDMDTDELDHTFSWY